MGLAPGLDLFEPSSTVKALTAPGFAQPSPLAGGFAGLTTSRRRAVLLTRVVAVIRKEKPSATTTLPSAHFAAHAPEGRKKKAAQ